MRKVRASGKANGWTRGFRDAGAVHDPAPVVPVHTARAAAAHPVGGGNFEHHEVRRLLAAYEVIPLISPRHYASYNRSIERAHQQMLRHLDVRIGSGKISARELRLEYEVGGHEMNHKRHCNLGGRTACAALQLGRPLVALFGRRKREEVFEETRALAVDIVQELDEHTNVAAETAFRYAAETWMQSNNMIRVTRNGEVLPLFAKSSLINS